MVNKTLIRKAFMVGAQATGMTFLARRYFSGIGAILMLHRIGEQKLPAEINDFLTVRPSFLDALLGDLKKQNYVFVSLEEAVDRTKAGHSDEQFVTITLDDGYRDNWNAGAPIFRKHKVPYTVFVSPGLVEGSATLWWEVLAQIIGSTDRLNFNTAEGLGAVDCATPAEKRAAYDELIEYLCGVLDEDSQRKFVADLAVKYGISGRDHTRAEIMDWQMLRTMAKDPLCTIGAHTINHFHLAKLERKRAAEEMEMSAKILELELGERPAFFAYPYGSSLACGAREVELAKELGFAAAVTTRHGLIHSSHSAHLHSLPRVSVNGRYQRLHYIHTMMSGITVPAANRGRSFVTV